MVNHKSYSFLGNIALVNFDSGMTAKDKKNFAEKIMKDQRSITAVLEKSKNFKGRLRKMETNHILGEKTKEVLYVENGCTFRFNIDDSYFSPRLSNERKEMIDLIKPNEEVLVLFAGVGPFSIVLGKARAKNPKRKRIVSNELNRKANKYGELNIERNKLKGVVELAPGDAKKVCEKMKKASEKFDVVLMPRPNLKDSFLEDAFKVIRKGGRIYYYDFCRVEDIPEKVEMVKNEAEKAKKKIKILKVKQAGDIAPFKARIRIDFKVLN